MIDHANDPEVRPRFLLTYGKRPEEEFYDLRADLHQIHNRADDPRYAMLRDHLARTLDQELRALGDPRARKEGDPNRFDEFPYYVDYGMECVEPPEPVKSALDLR